MDGSEKLCFNKLFASLDNINAALEMGGGVRK